MNTNQIFDKHYKRLRAEAIIKSTLPALCIGFLLNLVFSTLFWVFSVGAVWIGVLSGAAVGVTSGVMLYFFKYRPNEKTVARRIDREGLEERMITMLELDGDDSVIAKAQRNDAKATLGEVSAQSIKLNISSLAVILSSVAVAVSLFMTALGVLSMSGIVPHGKELFTGGADGTVTVFYEAGEGGSLRGDGEQKVELGSATSPVRAIADDGWVFVRWDDGVGAPERYEMNVTESRTIKAVFEKIENTLLDDDDSDEADDLPVGSAIEESGGGDSDETGGETPKDDGGNGQGGGKWLDRNQFIDGATYYRDYLEMYYQYSTGLLESDTEIPPEVIEFFEIYFSGI